MKMAAHNEFGIEGEDKAANYLIREGYTILDRNWRSGHKELDIVAEKDGTLVVAEVKTRTSSKYGNPEDAVTPRKIIFASIVSTFLSVSTSFPFSVTEM